jgi:hypothetical protein
MQRRSDSFWLLAVSAWHRFFCVSTNCKVIFKAGLLTLRVNAGRGWKGRYGQIEAKEQQLDESCYQLKFFSEISD